MLLNGIDARKQLIKTSLQAKVTFVNMLADAETYYSCIIFPLVFPLYAIPRSSIRT